MDFEKCAYIDSFLKLGHIRLDIQCQYLKKKAFKIVRQ